MEAFQSITLLLLFLFFVLSIILLIGARSRSRSHNSPPSPASLPILGHLHLLKKPTHRTLAALSARYGPVLSLRFGSRRVLVVSSASAAEECFTKHDIIFANRPRFLAGKHLGYGYTTVTWASYGGHWRNLRRIGAVELFSSSRLSSYAGIRREEVKAMIGGLVEECIKCGEPGFRKVELKPRFFELTMNVMMRMIAGKRYYGKEVKEVEAARRFQEIVEETFKASGATNLADFFPLLRIGEKKLLNLHKRRDAFLQSLVNEHRTEDQIDELSRKEAEDSFQSKEKTKTVIDVLLSLQQSDPEYYTDDIIKGTAGTLLAAGTDTSVVTMEWAMSLLLNRPETIDRARAEIDLRVGKDRILDESDLPNLPFLRCIIEETLRLHPAAPVLPAHESSEDCTVGGFHVRRGTTLLVNAWAIQRDPKLWTEPAEFKPERFADGAGEGSKGSFIPFGIGRRGCPGEGLAMRVVGLALGALIQCFEWEREFENVDLTEATAGLVAHKDRPLVALCKPRLFLEKALVSDPLSSI
ncbi:isoflavone 3'-hydroxylase-like [Iris pallida]|uniref:Isoflavone 3'-hydroxylase-like n=1 Tax=Iris pallida TaxID=29817 RepID=A0AAX6DUT5_IRIPA|nr:isoflavone 3'-hydroxylase-like [Iris pallida]